MIYGTVYDTAYCMVLYCIVLCAQQSEAKRERDGTRGGDIEEVT